MNGVFLTMDINELQHLIQESVRIVVTGLLPSSQAQPQKEILTAEEVCSLLSLKRSALYQKTFNKQIPHYKQGKFLYFHRSELEQWLAEGKQQTHDEDMQQFNAEFLRVNKKRLSKNK